MYNNLPLLPDSTRIKRTKSKEVIWLNSWDMLVMKPDLQFLEACITSPPLSQGSANCNPWAKSGQMLIFLINFIGVEPHPFTDIFSMAAFRLQWQS